MREIVDELLMDDVEDENRINEILLAFSEIISNLPEQEIQTVNEHIASFYSGCKKIDRLWLYVDLITYYCRNSKANYEQFAKIYFRNVLVLMND
jgi:hypothetical protein